MTRSSRPELFAQRPVRSDFGRRGEPVINLRRLFLLIALVGLAVGVGIGVNLMTGGEEESSKEIPVIKAEGPLKERPEQPGGLDVPHQDVTVFQKIDGVGGEEGKTSMENLLPPPDTPQPVPQAETPASSAALPDSEADKTALGSSVPPQTESLPPPITSAEPAMGQEKLIEDSKPVVVTKTDEQKQEPAKPLDKKGEEKKETPIKTETIKKTEQPKTVEAAKAEQAIARLPKELFTTGELPASAKGKATSSSESSGKTARIQLASLPDQRAAQDEAKRFQGKHAAALGDISLVAVRADLGSKGIFYRVMSQPLPEARAKEVCATLLKQKASCMVVK